MSVTVATTFESDGRISFTATPEAWRAIADSNTAHLIRVLLAGVGEDKAEPWMCGVEGATTRRACRIDIRHEPCPHHGEGSDDNRCSAPTRKNTPCRWNLKVHGPCSRHPDTWDIYADKVREAAEARDAEQRRLADERRGGAEEAARRAWEEALTVPCTYCEAGPGEVCRRPDGTEAGRLHGVRHKLAVHTAVANAATEPCPRCSAAPGSLCRTAVGNAASEAHAHRM